LEVISNLITLGIIISMFTVVESNLLGFSFILGGNLIKGVIKKTLTTIKNLF